MADPPVECGASVAMLAAGRQSEAAGAIHANARLARLPSWDARTYQELISDGDPVKVKWLIRSFAVLALLYVAMCAGVLWVMVQPPETFGRIIRHLPMPIVWGALPGPQMWMWARKGPLAEGGMAPDFTLANYDKTGSVTLSSFRGRQPVVLVFGSYT
jgi:hypothetical protein